MAGAKWYLRTPSLGVRKSPVITTINFFSMMATLRAREGNKHVFQMRDRSRENSVPFHNLIGPH